MTIKEKGYSHWDGELVRKRFSWGPITRYGISLTFKKRFFKFLLFLALAPTLVFLVGVYASERLDDFRSIFREASDLIQVNPAFFNTFLTNGYLVFMIILILVFAGAGLISDDLKYKSLQLYLSRPLGKTDYFLGKAGVIVFFISLVTLVPALFLFLMKLLFSGSLKFLASYPWLPLSIISYSLVVTVFFAFYTLLISSISKNKRYVIILIIGLYFFSNILFGIFFGIFRDRHFALFSIQINIQQIGAFLFKVKAPFDIPWVYSLLVLTGICIGGFFVLKARVRGVEVVK